MSETRITTATKFFELLAVAFSVFVFSYIFLYSIDFLPEPVQSAGEEATVVLADDQEVQEEVVGGAADDEAGAGTSNVSNPVAAASGDRYPTRIIIDKIDMDVSVLNPTSRSVEDLDAALLNGAVRHPDSADLEDDGHMFILGHSSYLPTVHNLNFRAFNGIQKLTWGDLIRVQSEGSEYVYRVTKSYEVKASVAELTLDHSKARLTLATCDSFGSKDDRFVVDAELIAVERL